jgi:hypothetical protein
MGPRGARPDDKLRAVPTRSFYRTACGIHIQTSNATSVAIATKQNANTRATFQSSLLSENVNRGVSTLAIPRFGGVERGSSRCFAQV